MSARNAALLLLGVLAISFSAILIRLAGDAPPLAIALYRNAIAAAILLPLALARHRDEMRSLTRRQWGLAVLAGAFLGAHFAFFVSSLDHTTVAAATVLVSSQPIWVAGAGHLLFGERLRPGAAAGIALALGGAVVVSGGDFGLSPRALFGDVLALLGAVTAAAYFLTGRSLRRRLSLLPYVAIAYTTAAVVLVPTLALAGQRFAGFRWQAWVLFLLMALVPQILGHTVFNYLLAHVEVTIVAVALMGEPVGATLLALAFLGETPPWTAVAGGVLILAGIYAAITAQARARDVPAPVE